MVYSTMQAHHGEMEIQSEPGRGTLVAPALPGGRSRGALGRPEANRPGPVAPLKGLRVLVVDDDDLMQAASGMLPGKPGVLRPPGPERRGSLGIGSGPD